MRNSSLIQNALLFILTVLLFSCQSKEEKVMNAQRKVKVSQNNLKKSEQYSYSVRQDSISKYEQFMIEAENKLYIHDRKINEFKVTISNKKNEVKKGYKKQLNELEEKNNKLKKKVAEYNDDGQDRWLIFKSEFNHDMEEYRKAFKNLTTDSIKPNILK